MTSNPDRIAFESWDDYARRWSRTCGEVRIQNPKVQTSERELYLTCLGDEWGDKASVSKVIERFLAPYMTRTSQVVEVGCGGGRVASQVVERCGRLLCLDTSEEMLRRCSEALASHLSRCKLVLQKPQGTTLPVPPSSQDLIYFFDVLVHLDIRTVYRYLRSSARALRINGHVVVHVATLDTQAGLENFIREAERGVNAGDFGSFEYLSLKTLVRMCQVLGLRLVDFSGEDRDNFYTGRDVLAVFHKRDKMPRQQSLPCKESL